MLLDPFRFKTNNKNAREQAEEQDLLQAIELNKEHNDMFKEVFENEIVTIN